MLLELYDLNHTRIAGLKNHKDAMVESELSTGDKTLSFLWHTSNREEIPHEYYIRTDKDEFVVKENTRSSKGYRKITAKLNLEDIEGRAWREFIIQDVTAKEAADYALTDTGWSCVSAVPTDRRRNISLKKVSSYQVLEKITEAFTCEIEYDTFRKIVYLKERLGEDKGVYFIDGLNLTELTDNADSYDFATIIVPIGADDLSIESVNGGNNFLENYQYSNKKKTYIWEDSSYTNPEALKEDAALKLKEISKPRRTLRAKTIDLARLKPEYYNLQYSVGDTVTIISNRQGIKEKQRITKTTEYLEDPMRNTCDISNAVLSFEDLQAKLFAAAECIGNITTDNGTVKGSSVDKIDVTQIIGLERYIAEDIDDLTVNYLYVRTHFGAPYAVIGQTVATGVQTTNLNVTGREDVAVSYIDELHAETFEGNTAVFKTIESDNIAALEARIDKITSTDITTEYLEAHYAQIDYANVDTAAIRQGFLQNLMVSQGIIADRVVGTEVVATDVLTGVSIYADDITAGTLSVDRLVFRGTENSIVYQLNQITGALQAENVDTINGEVITPRSITADRIVAKTITANEINVENLVATGLIEANKLTAANIDVNDLFAMKIVAAGSIESSNYAYASGNFSTAGLKLLMATGQITSPKFAIDMNGNAYFAGNLAAPSGTIGGFTIGANAIYKGADSMISTNPGVYLGTDGISIQGSNQKYVKISNGKITGRNNCDSVINPVDAVIDLEYSTPRVTVFRTSIDATELTTWYYDPNIMSTQAVKIGNSISLTHRGLEAADVYKEADGRIVKKGPVVNLLSADGTAKNATTAATAAKLGRDGNASLPMIFHWSGQAGQPTWLWGGVDGTNMYVYNPANFNVNFANSAGGATRAAQDGNGRDIATTYFPKTGGTLKGNIDMENNKHIKMKNTSGVLIELLGINTVNNIHMGDYNGSNISPVYMHAKGVEYAFLQTNFRSSGNGTMNLGDASHLWKTVYAKTGTINTSDRTKKHDIRNISEVYEQLFLKLQPKSFVFNDGDRVHIGAISQDVEEAMTELGIAPEQFAGFCKDVRYEYTEFNEEDGTPVEASKVPCTDEDGNLIYDYALRYQEFIFLTIHMTQRLWEKVDALEVENAKLKARMDALEKTVNALLSAKENSADKK